jgi:hypothetical protein
MTDDPKPLRRRGKRSSAKTAPPSEWKIRLYDPSQDPEATDDDYLLTLTEEDPPSEAKEETQVPPSDEK